MFSVKNTNLTIQEAANRPNPVFFDSVFAIGKSAKDENLRYIKQLKVRYGNFEHGGNNMIVCVAEKADDFLHFITLRHAIESAHFRDITEKERSRMKNEVRTLHSREPTVKSAKSSVSPKLRLKGTVSHDTQGVPVSHFFLLWEDWTQGIVRNGWDSMGHLPKKLL